MITAPSIAQAGKASRDNSVAWENFADDLFNGRLTRILFPPISEQQYKRWDRQRQRQRKVKDSNRQVLDRDESAAGGGD